MPIRLDCDCGRRLLVEDAVPTVVCPRCQATLTVPQRPPAPTELVRKSPRAESAEPKAGRRKRRVETLPAERRSAQVWTVIATPVRHVAFLFRFSFLAALVGAMLSATLHGDLASPDEFRLVRAVGMSVVFGVPLMGVAFEFLSNITIDANRLVVRQERWITLTFESVARSFARGLAAFLAGPALPIALSAWYWVWAGELTLLDRAILLELDSLAAGLFAVTILLASGRPFRELLPNRVIAAAWKIGARFLLIALVGGLTLTAVRSLVVAAMGHSSRDENWAAIRLLFVANFTALTAGSMLLELTGIWAARAGIALPSEPTAPRRTIETPVPDPAPDSAWMP